MDTRKRMKNFITIAFSVLFLSQLVSASVKTPAEESDYSCYSQHEAVTRFLSVVDHLSKEMTVHIIGKTKEARTYAPEDIYLCIITENGAGSPSEIDRKKPTVLYTASQHGNEQSAKEAVLWLIKDIALGEMKPLLKKLNFLMIPQANPYGNRFDQRANEQDLDLNRDHVKLESPEVKVLHRVFRAWMPEVTIDVHEKGDDYYRVSIGCVSNANIRPQIQDFSRNTILSEVEKKLNGKRITFYEYLVTQPMGVDSSAGVRYQPEDLAEREMMKRYSTTDLNDGRNSFGIYETFSFIQEGASKHDIETLKERTRWQYFGLRYFAEAIASNADGIVQKTSTFRKELMKKAEYYSSEDKVHLQMEYIRDEKKPELTLQRFVRTEEPIRGILKVDKKAGDVVTRDDMAPYPYPGGYKMETEMVKNWFPGVSPTLSVSRPLGYIVPQKNVEVVETLLDHGLRVEIFTRDLPLQIEAYEIEEIIPARYDYLPPQKIGVTRRELQTVVKQGDFYIPCAQPGANLLPCLLEPQSQYGFIRYQEFKLVPEKGNLFAFYRLTKSIELPLIPFKNWER